MLRPFGNALFQARTLFNKYHTLIDLRSFHFSLFNNIPIAHKQDIFFYCNTRLSFSTDSSASLPGFYKRPLPPNLISFSSTEGKLLFKETLQTQYLESYWTLAEQFHTQGEPAYILIEFVSFIFLTFITLWISNSCNGFKCFAN